MKNTDLEVKDSNTIQIKRPTLLVISGFSGTGKTTMRDRVLAKIPGAEFSLSMTTRLPRKNERNGVDYEFVSTELFQALIEKNELLEWEKVHGNFYGSPIQPVENALSNHKLLIFDVDVFGGLSIKNSYRDAVLVFLKPPHIDVLKKRLHHRRTDSSEEIELRLKRIPLELELSKKYDVIITNTEIDKTTDEICKLIRTFQDQ